mgnify:CR=1 FL=1
MCIHFNLNNLPTNIYIFLLLKNNFNYKCNMAETDIIVYDIEFIKKLSSDFNAILDKDIQNNLLEIKKNNKFIRRRSPIRLKYKISVADRWRDQRLNNDESDSDKHRNLLISNLNKLSNVNYPQIITIIKDLFKEIDDCLKLELTNVIFDKAITENIYSNLYANVIYDLSLLYSEIGETIILKCNDFFNKTHNNEAETINTENYEQLCEVIKSKARIVGGFIFIANLYKHNIVTYEIVLSYYDKLISYTEASPPEYIGKYIDAIVSIIDNCGKDLEKYDKELFKENFMEKCYNLTKNKDKLVPKYRFKLMGVCDKYESNWDESDDWNKV